MYIHLVFQDSEMSELSGLSGDEAKSGSIAHEGNAVRLFFTLSVCY